MDKIERMDSEIEYARLDFADKIHEAFHAPDDSPEYQWFFEEQERAWRRLQRLRFERLAILCQAIAEGDQKQAALRELTKRKKGGAS